MKIAIDASPAFLHLRTGIEEYSYQLIKNLRPFLLKIDHPWKSNFMIQYQ